MPEGSSRPRLVIADAGVDHDRVVRRAHDVTLDAQDHLTFRKKSGNEPRAVFLKHILGQGREEIQYAKKRCLLLDNAMDGDVTLSNLRGHWYSPFECVCLRSSLWFADPAAHSECMSGRAPIARRSALCCQDFASGLTEVMRSSTNLS